MSRRTVSTMLRAGRVLDVVLAVALVVCAVLTVAPTRSAPHPLTDLVVAAWMSGMAWRSTSPTVMALVIAGGGIAYAAIPGAPVTPLWVLIAVLVASFTVGSRPDESRGFVPAGALMASTLVLSVVTSTGETVAATWITPLVIVAAPYLAGRLVGRAQRDSAELVLLTRELSAEREKHVRAAAIEERHRVAGELHDVIAQVVSAMIVQAGAAETLLPPGSPARESLLVVRRTGREALAELEQQLGVLGRDRPRSGSLPGLGDIARLAESSGAALSFDVAHPDLVPAGTSLTIYRVVQEALTNARKHADGAQVRVLVAEGTDEPHELVVEVVNGPGQPLPETAGGSHGLEGMRERVGLYGGLLEAGAMAGGAWRVRATLPLPATVLVREATS